MKNLKIIKSKLTKVYIKNNIIDYTLLTKVINLIIEKSIHYGYDINEYNKLYIKHYSDHVISGFLVSHIVSDAGGCTILDNDYILFSFDIGTKVGLVVPHYNIHKTYTTTSQYYFKF